MTSNQSYFARLALQETARANRARSASAQSWHRELAEKFGRLARGECDEGFVDEHVTA